MCQLNLYCVPKTVEPETVIKVINNCFNTTFAEQITDSEFTDIYGLEDFNIYACSAMHCDCGSVISRFQDHERTLTWKQLQEELQNEELDKLYKIKNILEQPDYKERFKNYEKQQKLLWAEVEKTNGNIGEIERKLTSAVLDRTDISEEEKNKLMHEEVYPEINRLLLENEKRPERIAAMTKYQKFIQENNDLMTSMLYNTDPYKGEKRKIVSYDENGNEVITYENTFSQNIYDVIERTKTSKLNYEVDEFESIKGLVESLLEHCITVKLLAFWQDGDPIVIGNNYEVTFNDFKIEDIVYLKYKDTLTINKY